MRKIVLCSLFVSFGLILGGKAIAAGQVCHQTPDGRVVCNYIDRGGGYEQEICWRKNDGKLGADEEEIDGDWYAKKIGTDCTASKRGASWAQCVKNYYASSGRGFVRSCAAFDCQPDYLLYTTNTRREIPVVGENRKVGSQGLCREKNYLSGLCEIGCGCADDEECVLNEVSVTNHGRTVQAFIGEELCVCVKKEESVQPETCDGYTQKDGTAWECCMQKKAGKNVEWNESTGKCECVGDDAGKQWDWTKKECIGDGDVNPTGKMCTYKFDAYVKCGGREVMMHKQYEISEEMAKQLGATCPDVQKISPQALIEKDKARFEELRKQWCTESDDADISEAKDRLDAFMRSAKMNVNVWKNSEGKFNTARLASDLTAGVVLGTVGGIVSANVIKKKQVEKGFDALNCSVGGQKVADWGDEFSVGLRRY